MGIGELSGKEVVQIWVLVVRSKSETLQSLAPSIVLLRIRAKCCLLQDVEGEGSAEPCDAQFFVIRFSSEFRQ